MALWWCKWYFMTLWWCHVSGTSWRYLWWCKWYFMTLWWCHVSGTSWRYDGVVSVVLHDVMMVSCRWFFMTLWWCHVGGTLWRYDGVMSVVLHDVMMVSCQWYFMHTLVFNHTVKCDACLLFLNLLGNITLLGLVYNLYYVVDFIWA